jgi:hypothetical protein
LLDEASAVALGYRAQVSPGEKRFRVSFGIDAYRRLTMSATDLQTDKPVYQDYPVVKLT